MRKNYFIVLVLFLFIVSFLFGCDKHEHSYKMVAKVEATCTENGKKAYYVCEDCGEIFDENKNAITEEDLVIKALGHNTTKTEANEATCTEEGNTEYYTCSRCNNYFSDSACEHKIEKDSWVIGAKGHNLTHHEAKDPECVTTGNSEYWECSDCNKYFSDVNAETEIENGSWVITAKNHTLEHHEAVAETCTQDGNNEYWLCSDCGKYYSDQNAETEITAASIVVVKHHTLDHKDAIPSTCTSSGQFEYWECESCGKIFKDANAQQEFASASEIIDKTLKPHTLEHHEAHAETCTEEGNNEYWQCKVCEKYFSDVNAETEIENNSWIISAKGHNLTHHEAKDPECVTTGNSEYWECSNCNKYFGDALAETEIENNSWVISAKGHNLTHHEAVESTICTTIGNIEYWTCANCGKSFSDQNGESEIEENGWIVQAPHVWGSITYTWNSDHTECKAERICEIDETHIEAETVTTELDELESTNCYLYGLVAKFKNTDFEPQIYDYLRFTLNNDKESYTVYLGSHETETIAIPGTINNLPVTIVGERTFLFNDNIRTLIIPNTVITLEKDSISSTNITSLIFEEGSQLQYIGDSALYADYGLISISLPNTLISIGPSAFSGGDFSINFNGTMAEWTAISKGYRWNYVCPNLIIHCTDGDVDDRYVDDLDPSLFEEDDDDDWDD